MHDKNEAQLRAPDRGGGDARAATPTRAASATSTRASWTRRRSSAPASRRSAGELAAIDAMPSAGAARRRHGPARPPRRRHADRASTSTRTSATPRATCRSSAQGGLGLPDRDYYLDADDARFAQARARKLRRLPDDAARARRRRAPTPRRRPRRARRSRRRSRARSGPASRPATRCKTYNPVETAALPPLAAGFDWRRWLGREPASAGKRQRRHRRGSRATSPASARCRARRRCRPGRPTCEARLLDAYAPYLGKAFVDARFDFYGTALRGTTENQPRWKRGVDARRRSRSAKRSASSTSPRYFPPAHKARMEALVANLLAAYRAEHRHARLDGPGDQEGGAGQARRSSRRRSATRSAGATTARSRSARDDLVGNVMRARAFEYERAARQARQAGRPRRVGHDAADGQRLLQPVAQRDRLPGRRSCSRRSSTPRPTTPSTTAPSARSSATRSATASTTRAASTTATATCATGGPPDDRERFDAKTRVAGRAVLGVRSRCRARTSTAS